MQKTILVTDDAAFMRMMLKNILIPEKYRVVEAENGEAAIEQFGRYQPDLVFMDITMPVMDGITATRTMKEKFPQAVVVMCTAMGQQSMVIDSIKAGAKDFIVKPFDRDGVMECVRKFIG